MGKFSKIFHHIETKDLRNKHEQKKAAKIKEEKKKKEFKQYLVSTMETKKYNWREGMTTSDVVVSRQTDAAPGDGEVSSLNAIDASSYTATDSILTPGDDFPANVGTQIRASGTGEGHGGFNVGGNYLAFQGTGTGDANARFAVLSPVDSTDMDTLQIRAIVGNDSNGGEDPDEPGEELYVMYKTPAMPEAMFLLQNPDGSVDPSKTGYEDMLIGIGGAPNAGLNDYSVTIPDYARAPGTQFILVQARNSGAGYDNYGVTEIKFTRKSPITVFVPLDNPEASSFIRSAPPKSTPKKRKKAVDDKLQASDDYTGAKFGNEFPGREVRVGGEDPFASAKIGDDVKPSPQSRSEVKKAFGATDLKSALGQPDIQKADPQANVTNIVKSGKVKTQQSPPTRAQTTTPKQNTIQVVGKDGGIVNTIPVNTQTQPDQAQSGMSLSDFNTKKEKTKEQAILSKGKPQGPTSNNLITTVNETDIESEPDLLGELQNFGTNVSNKIEQGLDNALEYLAKPIPETTKGKGQGGRPVGDTTNRYDGVNTSGRYNLNLATELPISIVTGQPREIKISEEGAISMVNSIKSKEQLNNLSNFVTFNKSTPTDAQNTINPVGKTDGVLGDGWQIQGGSTFNVVTDKAGNIEALEIVSNKTLRSTSGGESVTRDPSGKIVKFTDIPDVPLEVVESKVETLLQNPIVDKFLGGLANVVKVVTLNQGGQGYEFMGETYNNAWDMMKDNPELGYDEFVNELATVGKNIAETTVQGTASNAFALRDFLQNIEIKSSIDDKGWKPFANNSDIENIGGAKGHVFSKAVIPVENISPEVLETLKEAQKNQANDPTLPTNQAPPPGEGKRNSAYYREQPDKVLPGGIVLKWIPGAVTYKQGNPSLGLADPKDWIPGAWTDITEYIPWTNIPASQAKKDGMDVSATTAPGDKNGRPQSDATTKTGTPTPSTPTPSTPSLPTPDEIGKGTFDADGNYYPPGFDPENLVTFDADGNQIPAEPEFGYEPSDDLNVKANDIIGKSMGDIKNVSEADLDFLIQNGYPVDDIFFGGQTQSPVGDLIALGLSAAAIKLALPLLLKAGGSLVSLVKKEWGMRALTDAAFKTFEKTGVMPPWYHWAAHKLLPQPVLNTYAKLMGLKSIPQSILPTGGTKAGNLGLLGLGAAAVAKITELMLQGRNKEADKLVVTEMTKLTNKNIDNMSEDELYKVFGDLDGKKFDEYDKFLESSKVPSSFRSDLKILDEYTVEYNTLNDEMNSLEDNPVLKQAFEAYTKNREEISNEMFKFSKYGNDGYRNNPDLDPRVLIPDPKGHEYPDYDAHYDNHRGFQSALANMDKARQADMDFLRDKIIPAYDKADAYAKANLTYDASSKMYQGTDKQILGYQKLVSKAKKLKAQGDKLTAKLNDEEQKYFAVQKKASEEYDELVKEYKKAEDDLKAKRKVLEDEYQEKYDYYRKIYDERFSYKTTSGYQDKLLKDGEDYTPAALFGQKEGKTVEGFKSLDLKTKEEYEKELEEIMNKSNKLADGMDWGGVDKLFLKELSMRAMNETVKAGGSESFKGEDYNPTKPKPSNRRAEASKKRREAEKKRKEREDPRFAYAGTGADAATFAFDGGDVDSLIAISKQDAQELRWILQSGMPLTEKQRNDIINRINGLKKSQQNTTPSVQVAHFKPRGKTLFERVSKLRKPNEFFNQDDIKPEFPENPPPKLDPKTGMHPEYGKKANRYKKLDPHSANAMPLTGDPETDEVVRKQKTINKIKKMARKA